MPTLTVSLQFEQDGVPMPNLTITRRLTVDSVVPFDTPLLGPGGISLSPVSLNPVQIVMMQTLDQPARWVPAGDVNLDAGGFILVFGASLSHTMTAANFTTASTQLLGVTGGAYP